MDAVHNVLANNTYNLPRYCQDQLEQLCSACASLHSITYLPLILPFFGLSQQRCHTSCQHSTSLTLCLRASRQLDHQRGLLPGHVDFLIVPMHAQFFAKPHVEIPDRPGKGQSKCHGAQTANPGSISTVMFQATLVLDELNIGGVTCLLPIQFLAP